MLHLDLCEFIERLLDQYRFGIGLEILIKAKNEYFHKTGPILEEDGDFETRLNCFYDWFLFNYQLEGLTTVGKHYLISNKLSEDLEKSLFENNYSIFQIVKTDLKGNISIKDIIEKKKIKILHKNAKVPILENDLFVGRVVLYQNNWYLMKGLCFLPQDLINNLSPYIKKIRALKKGPQRDEILLFIEGLKSKWLRYGVKDISLLLAPKLSEVSK